MTRRDFFRRAAVAASALAIEDPERLLWVPGAKTISIARPSVRPGELIWVFNPGGPGALALQRMYNAQITAQVEVLARHGMPPPRWYP